MSVLPVGFGSGAGTPVSAVERSLRFNPADTAYLNRTLGSSNRRTFTFSAWVKRSLLASNQCIFGNINFAGGGSTNQQFFLGFSSSDQLDLLHYNNGTSNGLTSSAVYRDPSAWYHVVCAIDTTQATSSDRMKLYVNGSQITAFASSSYPTQNTDTFINANLATAIGVQVGTGIGNSYYFGGYLTEVNFIDGQALTPSDFGETDSATGVWKPKAYSGTYGTNGFYLKFADNSGTTSTTLGKDSSGNGNNWTPNNFSVTAGAGNDSLVDSPTAYGTDTGVGGEVRGNYATFNPLFGTSTLANGNLQLTGPAGNALRASTLGVTSGKWYTEITVASALSVSASMGVSIYNQAALPTVNGTASRGYFYTGQKYSNGTLASYGTSFTNGDVIGVAIDLDNGKVWFSKNGTWQASGDPAAGTNAAYTDLGTTSTWFVIVQTSGATGGATCHANFGQRAFSYTAPSGFKALCTTNLPTPTIGATSTTLANDYFNTVLYTGTGSSLSVTGVGFQPDWVWIKERNAAADHGLYDAVRGVQNQLESNTTTAETAEATGLTAFGSDGFTVGALAQLNTSADTYVAWNWKANGAGSSNTAGTITSTVSANTTSGFSIVTYTGNGTAGATVGHGLGVTPDMIIVKSRSVGTGDWVVWHGSLTSSNNNYLLLNSTAAVNTANQPWNNTLPTSSVFSLRTWDSVNQNSSTYVAYCFDAVAGYSAFGSYTGNGSTDGPFVFTGFRPRWVMFKKSSGTSNWGIVDTARDTFNVTDLYLYANSSNAEATGTSTSGLFLDVLSNGFKLRGNSGDINDSATYIYMAFAESPFKYALAR